MAEESGVKDFYDKHYDSVIRLHPWELGCYSRETAFTVCLKIRFIAIIAYRLFHVLTFHLSNQMRRK